MTEHVWGQMNQPAQPPQWGQPAQPPQPPQWGQRAEDLDRLGWAGFQDMFEQTIHSEYTTAFKWRSTLPVLPTAADQDNIVDYRLKLPAPTARTPAVSMPSKPRLVSAEVRSDFKVRVDQRG